MKIEELPMRFRGLANAAGEKLELEAFLRCAIELENALRESESCLCHSKSSETCGKCEGRMTTGVIVYCARCYPIRFL